MDKLEGAKAVLAIMFMAVVACLALYGAYDLLTTYTSVAGIKPA